jgi:predicted nucleotidyltransferase component of viral defense system
MSNKIFEQMLARYEQQSAEDAKNALREVMQKIALVGLYRSGFFEKSAFYGGTCLRIFYENFNRFSEDMDFSLLKPDVKFDLAKYMDFVKNEFKALGRDVEISKKEKSKTTNIESAFLKDNTEQYNLDIGGQSTLKIKIEVDTMPPLGFDTEYKVLLLPFSFMTRCYTLPDLFAGKLHAFLFRSWRNRVKGRDWYDLEWYVRNEVALNFEHFKQRVIQTNPALGKEITRETLKQMLKEKISKTDIKKVREDVLPFIKNARNLEIWSADYFVRLVDLIILS